MVSIENIMLRLEKTLDFHSEADCFFQLIEGVDENSLDNLLDMMVEYYGYSLSKEQCYKITQNKNFSPDLKEEIFKLANDCIDTKGYLGTKINQFGLNTSSWISHSIQEARLCSHMASCIQVDSKKAYKMGLMHDYGRKYSHGNLHITLGFEHLYDLGYIEEAIGCLTHSFLNGNYYACFAPKNKVVDNKELYDFLQMYEYDSYDLILNLADLMATAEGIVPPKERIEDIETRRKLDPDQKDFFLNQLVMSIKLFLSLMGIKETFKDDFESLSSLLSRVLCIPTTDIKKLQLSKNN